MYKRLGRIDLKKAWILIFLLFFLSVIWNLMEPSLITTVLVFAVCVFVSYKCDLPKFPLQPVVGWILGHTAILPIWQERIAKLFGMGLYTLINYIGQKFFAFHQTGKAT